ncbi:MAG: AAA family ATPase [Candidatus Delongbacteria bacterium]|nr:AAA family ATPase [Candidatus Delongbacteria bacterium]MBN2834595.1 AAA family ATPase [Candidatus Delongbacteria bacterium]
MREKLKKIIFELNKGLVEREEVVKIALLSLLSQENLILFGPPGTAKSEISRRLHKVVKDGTYFEYLLTKFTTPEEIFGPLSIKELKEDRYKRKIEGYLPDSETAFLDEIFKANSSILNSLLTIINEKKFHNGNKSEEVPLMSLIGASNELPLNDIELNALYDRFLFRMHVDYIKDENIDKLLNLSFEKFELEDKFKLTRDEMLSISNGISKIVVPNNIKTLLKEIREQFNEEFKENNHESFSDRRLVKLLKILKVSAFTNGRKEVDESDLVLLIYCLWNNPNNYGNIKNIVIDKVKNRFSEIEEVINSNTSAKVANGKLKGSGKENDPFLIENLLDLYSIDHANYIDKGFYFKQVFDIDCTEVDHWHSIGKKVAFSGYYDGNGKKISNLKGDSFFGYVSENSILQRINIENAKIDAQAGFVISNSGKLKNCNLSGEVTGSGNSAGFVQKNCGTITDCNFLGNVSYHFEAKSGSDIANAGFVLENEGNITLCNYFGAVSIYSSMPNSDSKINLGGSGGVIHLNKGEVSKCFFKGSFTLKYEKPSNSYYTPYVEVTLGGLICRNEGTLTNSMFSGDIKSNTEYSRIILQIGGISCLNIGKISKCLINGEIDISKFDRNDVGGIICDGGKVSNSFFMADLKANKGNNDQVRRISCLNNESLENNYSLDSVLVGTNKVISNNENSAEGKDISRVMINQEFFKRYLDWDFKDIWEWDKNENMPTLKQNRSKTNDNDENKKIKDLNQFEQNIWL